MPTEDWRSPETIERLKRLERPGFAVEFLRRNPDYRRDYLQTERLIARQLLEQEPAWAALARRWRLQFRS
ncbi:transcriptional regulator domain-containing protein [Bradyrhizobium sp. USDA 4473]